MRKLFFRSKEKTSVNSYELWEVRWASFDASRFVNHPDVKEQVAAFPTKSEADEFVCALRDANDLMRNSDLKVEVKKQD